MHVINLDCSALSDEALTSVSDFLASQDGIAKIRVETFYLDEDPDDEPMILNIDVTDSLWSKIIVGPCDALENAAKWLISLLIGWGEDKVDQIIGYDHTQNMVVIGNPDDWGESPEEPTLQ